MKTPPATPHARSTRPRSRYGYDHRWWGSAARDELAHAGYWAAVKRPLPCLAFVLPILMAYEVGVGVIGGPSADLVRTGADAWMRQVLARAGLTDRWLLPGAIVTALVGWQALDPKGWRFSPFYLAGMAGESVALALALVGSSRLIDLFFVHLEGGTLLAVESPALASYVGFLGAGVYEEALFRLALVPGLYGLLRLFQMPGFFASTLAVCGSGLLFSLAHHAGAPGEPFTLYAFIFRWLAGVYFAWIFLGRGFGIAVGTHAAYDILVGGLGWHL